MLTRASLLVGILLSITLQGCGPKPSFDPKEICRRAVQYYCNRWSEALTAEPNDSGPKSEEKSLTRPIYKERCEKFIDVAKGEAPDFTDSELWDPCVKCAEEHKEEKNDFTLAYNCLRDQQKKAGKHFDEITSASKAANTSAAIAAQAPGTSGAIAAGTATSAGAPTSPPSSLPAASTAASGVLHSFVEVGAVGSSRPGLHTDAAHVAVSISPEGEPDEVAPGLNATTYARDARRVAS